MILHFNSEVTMLALRDPTVIQETQGRSALEAQLARTLGPRKHLTRMENTA
jgi:hypothetical protein